MRVDELDWLRALAVLLVVFLHSAPGIAPGGYVGIDVFFVLSGYLIASVVPDAGPLAPRRLGAFWLRRLSRIYPMFLVDVVAALAIMGMRHPERLDGAIRDLPRILTFSGYSDVFRGHGLGVLWTLNAEFWFYLSFPFVIWVGRRSGRLFLVLFSVLVASLVAKVLQKQFFTLVYYDQFVLGALVCFALGERRLPALLLRPGAAWVGLAAVLVAAAFPPRGEMDLLRYAPGMLAAMGTAMLIAALRSNPPRKRIPPLAFIGRMSYSVYFIHGLVIDAFPELPGNLPAYLALVLAVSACTWRWIEEPFIRWGRAVARRIEQPRAAHAPAVQDTGASA